MDAALPHRDCSRALVRANVRLAAAGFGLGSARTVFVGFFTTVRNLGNGEAGVQYVPLPRYAAAPHDRPGALQCSSVEEHDGRNGGARALGIFQRAWFMDRPGSRGGFSRRSGSAAPPSRTDLAAAVLIQRSQKEKQL